MTEQIPQNVSETSLDKGVQPSVIGVGAVASEVILHRSRLPRPSEAEIDEIRAGMMTKSWREYKPPTEEQIAENKKLGLKADTLMPSRHDYHNPAGGQWIPDIQYHGKYSE